MRLLLASPSSHLGVGELLSLAADAGCVRARSASPDTVLDMHPHRRLGRM